MKFSIKNFLRKWVRKLFPRNSIEKEMKVQIVVSGPMDNAIQLWKDMYENHPPWIGEDGTLCTEYTGNHCRRNGTACAYRV